MAATITISVATHWQRLQNLISEALESGSLATFGIAGYDEPPRLERRDDPNEVFRYLDYPVNEGGAVWLYCRHDEGESEPGAPAAPWVTSKAFFDEDGDFQCLGYKLDIPTLEKGLEAFSQKSKRQFGIWFTESGEEDFFTGDCFLQCCIFGEVVYG